EYDDEESSAWLAAAIEFGWAQPPTPLRETVPVNATLPAVSPEQVATVLERFPGCRTVKVKVAEKGQNLADDVARVSATRELLGPAARIRLDANGGWSLAQAAESLTALAGFGLEYAEQPCASVAELAELRSAIAGLGVPIAADESV